MLVGRAGDRTARDRTPRATRLASRRRTLLGRSARARSMARSRTLGRTPVRTRDAARPRRVCAAAGPCAAPHRFSCVDMSRAPPHTRRWRCCPRASRARQHEGGHHVRQVSRYGKNSFTFFAVQFGFTTVSTRIYKCFYVGISTCFEGVWDTSCI